MTFRITTFYNRVTIISYASTEAKAETARVRREREWPKCVTVVEPADKPEWRAKR